VNICSVEQFECFLCGSGGPDDIAARLYKRIFDHHGYNWLVFDNENVTALQKCGGRVDGDRHSLLRRSGVSGVWAGRTLMALSSPQAGD
jgi:hypothetical protein